MLTSDEDLDRAAMVLMRTGQLADADLRAEGIRQRLTNGDRMEIAHRLGVITSRWLRAIPPRMPAPPEWRR